MKRKIFSVLLICTLVITMFGLTGCKNDNKEKDSNNNSSLNNVQNNSKSDNKGSEKTVSNVEISSNNYGDKVNYSITVNNVELNDWRVFLSDDKNVYIIYGNGLPKEALPASINSNSHIIKNENKIYSLDRKDIIEALTLTDVWKYLLDEKLVNKGATAVGSPTLEQFVSSYNAKYTNDKFNIKVGEKMEDGYTGYSAKNEQIVKETSIFAKGGLHDPEGYIDAKLGRENESKAGTLYFPNATDAKALRMFYWLSTPHNDDGAVHGGICMVGGLGYVTGGAGITAASCRPVISIPINCLNQKNDGSWNID